MDMVLRLDGEDIAAAIREYAERVGPPGAKVVDVLIYVDDNETDRADLRAECDLKGPEPRAKPAGLPAG